MVVAIIGPPERWAPLCREHRQEADFLCVSPLRAQPKDDAGFSLFLVDLFSGRYDVLVATCPTVIEAMVGMAEERKMLERLREATERVELVVIGERTALCATDRRLKVSSQAPEATTEALLGHLNKEERRGTVALLRSDQGSPQLVQGLLATGWRVEEVQVFSLLLDESEEMEGLMDRLEDGELDVLVFPTPAHVQAFMLQLQGRCGHDDAIKLLGGIYVTAIGPETKLALEGYGIEVGMVPDRADARSMLRLLMEERREPKSAKGDTT